MHPFARFFGWMKIGGIFGLDLFFACASARALLEFDSFLERFRFLPFLPDPLASAAISAAAWSLMLFCNSSKSEAMKFEYSAALLSKKSSWFTLFGRLVALISSALFFDSVVFFSSPDDELSSSSILPVSKAALSNVGAIVASWWVLRSNSSFWFLSRLFSISSSSSASSDCDCSSFSSALLLLGHSSGSDSVLRLSLRSLLVGLFESMFIGTSALSSCFMTISCGGRVSSMTST
mmetsp:Transcript_328/g.368  ORF Transcript_328/g.368 Transcript_328/m.368 type:complete len:235 (-) Transcript_328:137-841(-)